MAERLTPEQVQAMRARAGSATPGPWTTESTGANYCGFSLNVVIAATAPGKFNRIYAVPPGGRYPAADQTFIAKARTDVPALCDTADSLQAENERLREFANEVYTKLAGDTDTDRLQQASASWVTLVSTLANLALKARAVLHQEPPKGE